jgi:hypothetical protein
VQSAVNSASDGDEVIVPQGTATWTSSLNVSRNLTLRGSGIGKTVIVAAAVSDPKFNRNGGALLNVQLSKDAPLFRLTGFEFRGSGAPNQRKHLIARFSGGSDAAQKPLVIGVTSSFRLDHCRFAQLDGLPASFDNLIGVIDHVEYIGQGDFCFVQHSRWGGHELGHGSWADDPYWGSNKFLFFEDCDFTNEWVKSPPYGFDAYLGARFVVRHCHFHGNTAITGHGTETPQRGTKQIEIYDNTFEFSTIKETKFPHLRGGSVIIHDNKLTNCFAGMGLHDYRQWGAYAQWGYSDGRNVWDENDPNPRPYAVGVNTGPPVSSEGSEIIDTQSDAGGAKHWEPGEFAGIEEGVTYIIKNMTAPLKKDGNHPQSFLVDNAANRLKLGHVPVNFATGDHYEVWKVKTSLDQPGQGKGRLLRGNVRYGGASFADGSFGSWPQRGFPREPCYSWNNVNLSGGVGSNMQINLNTNQHSIKENRDYFNYGEVGDAEQQIGPPGHTYTYHPYIYPHPLQHSSSSREH